MSKEKEIHPFFAQPCVKPPSSLSCMVKNAFVYYCGGCTSTHESHGNKARQEKKHKKGFQAD